jgi:DNA-binding NtrC family response regulator
MSQEFPISKRAVLIVEDETLTRLSAMTMVEAAGFQAVGVPSADDAMLVLNMRDDIRAVFTDVQMPGGMDGIELIRIVKERWPDKALLVTSGKTDLGRADVPSTVRILPKPYLPFQIEAALRQLLG